jgi:glycosyltransferase involved in cell wall biosynthesis
MLRVLEHLFVSYSFSLGGAERLLLDLVPALDEPPGLACPPGPLAEQARHRGLEIHPLHAGKLELRRSLRDRAGAPFHLAAQGREVRRLVRAVRPRRVVAWSMRALLAADVALTGWGRSPPVSFQHNDFLPGPLIGAAVRRGARRARLVCCVSHAVASDLDPRGRLAPQPVVLHPGVDLERFQVREPLPEGPEVLVLGALVPWKRPELALGAVAAAAERLPGLRLTFVGTALVDDRPFLERLQARAQRPDLHGRVRFAGAVDDPRDALAGASCLLHCADREPFGMALVEALACSRPVVAPAAGGPAEIVDRSCGHLFTPGDAGAAAAALIEVLGDPSAAAALGEAGRERARRHFDLERARARFRELLATAPASAAAG